MKIGTTYPSFIYDISSSFKEALGNSTETIVIMKYEDLESVDLVAFPGGEDVDPYLYGMPNIKSYGINHKRDEREKFLYKHSKALGKPMFGMCRGLQFLSVMLGCNLVQDIYSELEVSHGGSHPIEVTIDSIVSRNFNTVNSLHHQGLRTYSEGNSETRRLAERGIYITSHYKGVAESIESNSVLATQFHPEFMHSRESNGFFVDVAEWALNKNFTFDVDSYMRTINQKSKVNNASIRYSADLSSEILTSGTFSARMRAGIEDSARLGFFTNVPEETEVEEYDIEEEEEEEE